MRDHIKLSLNRPIRYRIMDKYDDKGQFSSYIVINKRTLAIEFESEEYHEALDAYVELQENMEGLDE